MAEEHGFQAPEGPRLCANNCGFFGSPATQNLCSKCYRDLSLKKDRQNNNNMSLFTLPSPASSSSSSSSKTPSVKEEDAGSFGQEIFPGVSAGRSTTASEAAAQPKRCMVCMKKVGLTGFRCRCGTTFCGTHRYPEQHGCTFDFKAMGRDAIAKANPIVKADKLDKI